MLWTGFKSRCYRLLKRYVPLVLLVAIIFGVFRASIGIGLLFAPTWLVSLWHLLFGIVIFRFILRAALFPGSLHFWKSSVEHSFKSHLSHYLALHVEYLYDFVDHLTVNNQSTLHSVGSGLSLRRSRNQGTGSSRCFHNISLLGAAYSWIAIQNAELSLSCQTFEAASPLSIDDRCHSFTSTRCCSSLSCRRSWRASTQVEKQGGMQRCEAKKQPFRVILRLLFFVTFNHFVPRWTVNVAKWTKRCFSKHDFSSSNNCYLSNAFYDIVTQIDQCLVLVPTAFGSPKHKASHVDESQGGCETTFSIDIHSRSQSLFGRATNLNHPDSLNSSDLEDSTTSSIVRRPSIMKGKTGLVSTHLIGTEKAYQEIWYLGSFLNEVYQRHLRTLQNGGIDGNESAADISSICSGLSANQTAMSLVILESLGNNMAKDQFLESKQEDQGTKTLQSPIMITTTQGNLGVSELQLKEHNVKGRCGATGISTNYETNDRSDTHAAENNLQSDSQFDKNRVLDSLQATLEALQPLHDEVQWSIRGCPYLTAEFLLEPPVGSLNHLRTELQLKHYGVQFWVTTKDGYQIDAMFLPRRSCRSSDVLHAIRERLQGGVSVQSKNIQAVPRPALKTKAIPTESVIDGYARHTSLTVSTNGCSPSGSDECLINASSPFVSTLHPSTLSSSTSVIASSEGGLNDSPIWRWGPVVVFCNPNAGFYETTAYHDDWLEFYIHRDVNLVVFNYRGFGRSEGSPSPTSVAEDAEDLVAFLLSRYIPSNLAATKNLDEGIYSPLPNDSERVDANNSFSSALYRSNGYRHLNGVGVTHLGIHGRSIGGIAAIHVAWKFGARVKWLCADRTFWTLDAAAFHLMGSWSSFALRLGSFKADNVMKYMTSEAYKVICWDPDDQVIANAASLKSGVCKIIESSNYSPNSSSFNKKNHFISLGSLVRSDQIREFSPLCEASHVPSEPLSFFKFDQSYLIEVTISLDVLRSILILLEDGDEIDEIETSTRILRHRLQDAQITQSDVRDTFSNLHQPLQSLAKLILSHFTSCGLALGSLMKQLEQFTLQYKAETLRVFLTSLVLWGTTPVDPSLRSGDRLQLQSTKRSRQRLSNPHPQKLPRNLSPLSHFLLSTGLLKSPNDEVSFDIPLKALADLNSKRDRLNENRSDLQFLEFNRAQARLCCQLVSSAFSKQLDTFLKPLKTTSLTEIIPSTQHQSSQLNSRSLVNFDNPSFSSPSSVDSDAAILIVSSHTNSNGVNSFTSQLFSLLTMSLRNLENFLTVLNGHFRQTQLLQDKDDSSSTIKSSNSSHCPPPYGFLVPLACGHNGCLNEAEVNALHFHFQFCKLWENDNQYEGS